MTRITTLVLLALAFLVPSRMSRAQEVDARPIDRATVRIVGVSGMQPFSGHTAHQARQIFVPRFAHGSGVRIADDLIATAAHVVDGIDLLMVRFVDDENFYGGVVVAIDTDHDVALVRIAPHVSPVMRIPSPLPRLRPGQPLDVTGYPIDVMQRYPAAAQASLSRLNNEGWLELSASLNPGNSGGPVFNHDGDLVGIISARGSVERGIQGIALAAQISHVVALRDGTLRDASPPRLPADLTWLFDDTLQAPEPEQLASSSYLSALAAHRAWRNVIKALVDRNVASPEQLPETERLAAEASMEHARRALALARTDSAVLARYALEPLGAQLTGHARGATSLLATSRPAPSSLRVTTPAEADLTPPRLTLRMGPMLLRTFFGARAGVGLNVLRLPWMQVGLRLDAFIAGSLSKRGVGIDSSGSVSSNRHDGFIAGGDLSASLRVGSVRGFHGLGSVGMGLVHASKVENDRPWGLSASGGLGYQVVSLSYLYQGRLGASRSGLHGLFLAFTFPT